VEGCGDVDVLHLMVAMEESDLPDLAETKSPHLPHIPLILVEM
jgi:hypothetical protein